MSEAATKAPDRIRTSSLDRESLFKGYANLPTALGRMGFQEMRKGQDNVVINIMGLRDTICVLPTSVGKSGCFIIPTLALGFHTLVLSPLQALMRDQVQSAQRKGIRAGQMVATQTESENVMAARLWIAGELDLFYVAPERMQNEVFQEAMRSLPPDFVAVDEGHTCSEWSDNFRPAYAHIGTFIKEVNPKVVAAFTATMPPEVEKDMRRCFGMDHAEKLVHYPRRTNLVLTSDELVAESQLINDLKSVSGPAIVYCSTITNVNSRASLISEVLKEDVAVYHGKDMSPTAKKLNMDNFMEGRCRVMVATNAFGMGVDKADVRSVISADYPRSVEELAQLLGRGGRDGEICHCKVYASKKSRSTQEFFIKLGHPNQQEVTAVYQAVCRMADTKGDLHVSNNELADQAGIDKSVVSAAKSILQAAGVINAVKLDADEKVCFIGYKGTSEDQVFREWRAHVEYLGTVDENGFYAVEQGALEGRCGVKIPTIKKRFKLWEEEKLVAFIPPTRARPMKLIGDLSLVDFDRLREKAKEAYAKLDQVQDYLDTPHNEKHAFIEKYFGVA